MLSKCFGAFATYALSWHKQDTSLVQQYSLNYIKHAWPVEVDWCDYQSAGGGASIWRALINDLKSDMLELFPL